MYTRWRSLVSQFGFFQSRSYSARLRLTQAYQAVFHGSPRKEDQELVLADLMSKSGFNKVSPADVPADVLRHREGMRELFGHIFSQLSISGDDMRALEEAARREAVADDQHNT